MKASILRALATLGLSAALGPVSLMAQTTIHARIPFDFTIGSKSFAAGEYRVVEQFPKVLYIRSADGRSAMMALAHDVVPNAKPGEAKLTFNKYGNRYFLSQVSHSGRGWELPKSAVEKELIAQKASSNPVVVAGGR
jgi:hypothetical protein